MPASRRNATRIPTAAVGRKNGRRDRPAVTSRAKVEMSTSIRPTRARTLLRCHSSGRNRQTQASSSPTSSTENSAQPASLATSQRAELSPNASICSTTSAVTGSPLRTIDWPWLIETLIGATSSAARAACLRRSAAGCTPSSATRSGQTISAASLRSASVEPAEDLPGSPDCGPRPAIGVAQLGRLELIEDPGALGTDRRPARQRQRQQRGPGVVGQTRAGVLEERQAIRLGCRRRRTRCRPGRPPDRARAPAAGRRRLPWPACSRTAARRRARGRLGGLRPSGSARVGDRARGEDVGRGDVADLERSTRLGTMSTAKIAVRARTRRPAASEEAGEVAAREGRPPIPGSARWASIGGQRLPAASTAARSAWP